MQFEQTEVTGTISRGTGTRLMSCALSSSDPVPVIQARLKKL
jgi:hypothetical protein